MKLARSLFRPTSSQIVLFVAIVFFVAALLMFIGSARLNHVTTGPSAFIGLATDTVHQTGSVAVAVKDVHTTKGSGHYQASQGLHYVVLTLVVHNRSPQPISIAPANDTYCKSTSGLVAYLTPLELEAPFHSGQLLPGESVQGQLSYLVRDDQQYRYYIESDWSGGAVSFMLK